MRQLSKKSPKIKTLKLITVTLVQNYILNFKWNVFIELVECERHHFNQLTKSY